MSILKRNLIFVILFIVFSLFFSGIANVYASGINMNAPVNSTGGANTSLSSGVNTSAVVTTVDSIEDTPSTFGFNEILNILLIAIGFVIILLAIAILIRLRK